MGFDVADMGRRYSLDYGKGENGKGRINKSWITQKIQFDKYVFIKDSLIHLVVYTEDSM